MNRTQPQNPTPTAENTIIISPDVTPPISPELPTPNSPTLSPPQSPEHTLNPSHEPSETLEPSATPEPSKNPDQTETPEQLETPEPTDFLKTVVDFESLQFLKNKTYKKVVPKPVQLDVNVCFHNFITEVQAWIDLLKADCTSNVNPAATDLLWETFRRTLDDESLKFQDLCHS